MRADGSNRGYGREAAALGSQYESITFEQVHGDVLHLFPASPALAVDIGAGTGRDAAALARLGHRVFAIEPTAELREIGRTLHASSDIAWIDDGLPDLTVLAKANQRFDLILLTAVWMHLGSAERQRGMQRLGSLLAPMGQIVLTLRHGPVPEGRQMFAVTADETIVLASAAGLLTNHHGNRRDTLGRPDVSWTVLGFRSGP